MSRVDLDAIQARADAATPGPWVVEDALGTVMAHPQRPIPPADQLFIAYARSDVPAMVAELRVAREQVAFAELAKANIRLWLIKLRSAGWGNGAIAVEMREFLAAYEQAMWS